MHGVTCDVRKPEDAERLVAQVRDALVPIDVLVNNTGVTALGAALPGLVSVKRGPRRTPHAGRDTAPLERTADCNNEAPAHVLH